MILDLDKFTSGKHRVMNRHDNKEIIHLYSLMQLTPRDKTGRMTSVVTRHKRVYSKLTLTNKDTNKEVLLQSS